MAIRNQIQNSNSKNKKEIINKKIVVSSNKMVRFFFFADGVPQVINQEMMNAEQGRYQRGGLNNRARSNQFNRQVNRQRQNNFLRGNGSTENRQRGNGRRGRKNRNLIVYNNYN